MIKGIIFDLDGTILDTIEDIQTAINLTMEDYNFPLFSYDDIRLRVGNGNRLLVQRCLPQDKQDLLDEAEEKYYEHYGECYLDKTKPFDGIIDLLKELNNKQLKVAVNTNKNNIFCETLINNKFPNININKIVGKRENLPTKPDPSGVYEILDELKLNKDEVLYVGDSEVDVKTGINAGLKTVWVSWGSRTLEDVKELNPTYMIDEPNKLIKIIDDINKPEVVKTSAK